MKITTSYKSKILGYNSIFEDTARIYRRAISFFADIINTEWDVISKGSGTARNNLVEHLTLRTARNPEPKYNFNSKFYKMPCYLRRAAIQAALGAVPAYKSNYENWETSGKIGKPPRLQVNTNQMPVLYKGNMYEELDDTHVRIKIYHQRDWMWLDVRLKEQDARYIRNHCAGKDKSNPTLMKRGKQWYLNYAFVEKVKLKDMERM